MSSRHEPKLSFTIPDTAWSGSPSDAEDGRLMCQVRLNGIPFHAEALPVDETPDGLQCGVDPVSESRLSGLAAEFDAPGFQTIDIRGRSYVITLTPHGR